MRYYRPTWAEVNLGKIAHNFNEIKKLLSPKVKVLVCVKADAYGHGLVPVAKKVISCGADFLGVASIDEGIALRENHIRTPVLILGMILSRDIDPLFRYNLTPTVCTKELALAIDSLGRTLGRKINVHIKLDSGMGRLGILYKDIIGFIKKVHRMRFINIEGIFTHFPLADSDSRFTLRQIEMLGGLVKKINHAGIRIPLMHAANSMGVIGYKSSHFNMVRPGLAIYGLYPKADLKIRLKPVLSLKTKVIFVKNMPRGYGISYGHDYITKKATKIITLPIGYGDGYPRNLSNRAPVLIQGRRFLISGRICMDQIMVDVGGLKVNVGDEVVLIGTQGAKKITAEELAMLAQTIPYEIVCGLGSRIPRIYLDK
jgi:alanine racemase